MLQECPVCHEQFKSRPHQKRKFCSLKCSATDRSNKNFVNGQQRTLAYRKGQRTYMLNKYGHICQICKNTEWMNQPIPLELDHIDGNATNNFEDNLRMVCPNCHAQTPTYKAKNKGNGRQTRGLTST